MRNSITTLSKLVALAIAVPVPLLAQTASAPAAASVEEIIVTAQKRAENIQNVPLSIMAVSGATLEDAGIQNPTDLGKLMPTLQINNTLFATGVVIRIRGFGSAANTATDSDVASYVDSAFIPRPGAILGTFLDVKSVEVLSGPQGTLFGRNAAMGAISINTNAPSMARQSFEAKVEAASFGSTSVTGIANLPVNDNFALRLAANKSKTDGIFKNNLDGKTYGARDQTVGRLAAKWDISKDVSWTLRADTAKTSGDGANPGAVYVDTASASQLAALATFNTRFGGTPQVYNSTPTYNYNQVFKNPNLSDKQTGVTSELSWALSPVLTARLINTTRDWNNTQVAGDTIATSLDLLSVSLATKSKATSHELQLISSKGAFMGNKVGFTSGLYYFQEDFSLRTGFNAGTQFCSVILTNAGRAVLIPGCQAGAQVDAGIANFAQNAKSNAAYVQADIELQPGLELDLGVRSTKDKKSGSFSTVVNNAFVVGQLLAAEGPEVLDFSDSRTSVRASLSWHVSDKVMAFATYSTGYKSGGFNSGAATPALNPALRTFASELVDDIEVGVKSVLMDGKFLFNATLFDTKLKNFQDRSFNGTAFVVRNSGDVRSKGIDIDGQIRAMSGLKFTYGLTVLDSKYGNNPTAPGLEGCTGGPGCPTTQVLTGQTISFAPKQHGNVGAQWDLPTMPGGITTSLAASMNFSSSFLTANNNNPQSSVKGYQTTDLRANFFSPDGKWQFDLFSQNAFDKRYYVTTVAQVLGAAIAGVNDPATGATVYRGFLGDPRRFGVRVSVKF